MAVVIALIVLVLGAADAQPMPPAAHDAVIEVGAVLDRLEEVRELEALGPIPAGTHTRDSLRRTILEKLEDSNTVREIRAEEAVLRHLGILAPDVNYYDLVVELLTTQISGFYDPETASLYLLEDLPASALQSTLAHELFHAIQDQHFGLQSLREDWDDADDRLLAVSALIEGDAMGVMLDFMFRGLVSITEIPGFTELMDAGGGHDVAVDLPAGTPYFLQEQLLFPYTAGLEFVHFIKWAGSWRTVDAVYADPPQSTEQILHPERYLNRDSPTWLQIEAEPFEALGYVSIYDQVFGEFQWRSLFGQFLSESTSERSITSAVEGWDGDRLLAFESNDGTVVLVGLSVWDSVEDAAQFETLLLRWMSVHTAAEIPLLWRGEHGATHVFHLEATDTWFAVERWGDMVAFVDGVPGSQSEPAVRDWLDNIWSGRSRGPYE